LLRNLLRFAHRRGAIETTVPKAKASPSFCGEDDHPGKRGDLSARRQAGALPDDHKDGDPALFDTVGFPRFGVASKVVTCANTFAPGWRKGDGAVIRHSPTWFGSEKLQD